MFVYGTGTRHGKVLTKSIPRVRDVRPRVMVMYAFLAITFISDITFFFKFTAQRGRL